MQVCVLYAGKTREGGKLADIAKAMAKGIESQGHRVDVVNMYEEGIRLTVYDYDMAPDCLKTGDSSFIREAAVAAGLHSPLFPKYVGAGMEEFKGRKMVWFATEYIGAWDGKASSFYHALNTEDLDFIRQTISKRDPNEWQQIKGQFFLDSPKIPYFK